MKENKMNAKQRKIIFVITLSYTVFILFFMFLAFGRADTIDRETGYTFMFCRIASLGCPVYRTFYILR
ncbi:hypothetical protein HMSSN139_21710 [Paenibacillus sp. HMSSN-139]|nr:hypothetical protein HMSSN139_21710 [Paenibacillus sp. HMSSN-139]